MKIILVRHGQTDCNRDGINMGRKIDVSINETGRVQMEQIIPEIRGFNPEVIISSPMKRTSESAEIMKEVLKIPIEFDDRIVEIDMGSISGKSREEAASLMSLSLKQAIYQYRKGQYDYTPFGGESADNTSERANSFFKDLAQREERCVIVVSHGALVRLLHMAITGESSLIDKGIPNAAVFVLEYA